jgi:hypothetical protein
VHHLLLQQESQRIYFPLILSTNTYYIPEEYTAFKAEWLLYIPASLTLKNSTFFQQYAIMYFVGLQKKKTASISPNSIN